MTTNQPPSKTASSTLNRQAINPLPTLEASCGIDREPGSERSARIETNRIRQNYENIRCHNFPFTI